MSFETLPSIPDTNERRRLREELFDPFTRRLLSDLIRPGWCCLDAGAGRGSIASWLAEQVGSSGRVVAVDSDADLLSTLDSPRFERRHHDLASDGPVASAFDLVHSRFVLEHIPTRNEVIAELASQLRPGGWLFVQDADFSPPSRAASRPYATAMAAFEQTMKRRGTDYGWTSRLPARIAELGLEAVGTTGEVVWFEGGSELARFWASNLAELRGEMVQFGAIDKPTYQRAIDILLEPGEWLPSILVLAAWGQRPQVQSA